MTKLALTDLTIQKLRSDGQEIFWDTLPGFGIKVGKRTKTFVVKKGNTLTSLGRYGELTLKEARKAAMQALSTEPEPVHSITPMIDAFLEAKARTLKPYTLHQYRMALKFFAFTGKAEDITRDLIFEKLATLDGKPAAQNMNFAVARAFLNWIHRQGYIKNHPIMRVSAPNKHNDRDRVLTDQELKAIWDATDFKPYGHIVRVLILTGQRKMEIAGVREFSETITFPTTKNQLPHVIPITALIQQHLPILPYANWSDAKAALDKKCGVTGWTLHDCRRTFATNCARIGVPIHVIERILNHRTGAISGVARTYNRYGFLPEMREAIEKHEQFILKNVLADSLQ